MRCAEEGEGSHRSTKHSCNHSILTAPRSRITGPGAEVSQMSRTRHCHPVRGHRAVRTSKAFAPREKSDCSDGTLGHTLDRSLNQQSIPAKPQRGFVTQPRVRLPEQPWVRESMTKNAERRSRPRRVLRKVLTSQGNNLNKTLRTSSRYKTSTVAIFSSTTSTISIPSSGSSGIVR